MKKKMSSRSSASARLAPMRIPIEDRERIEEDLQNFKRRKQKRTISITLIFYERKKFGYNKQALESF